MASGDVLAFLQSDWVALWAATLYNSMYGNVPGLFSPYKIGLNAPGYPSLQQLSIASQASGAVVAALSWSVPELV